MHTSLPTSHFRVAVLFGVIALGLGFVPPAQVAAVRTNLLDALAPGLDCLHGAQARLRKVSASWSAEWLRFDRDDRADRAAFLENRLKTFRQRARQLEIANARLHRRLRQIETTGPSPYPSRRGKPLVDVELLEAAVLGRENGAIGRTGPILNRGRQNGLMESDLVLDSGGLLIDQGEEADLAAGHPVYSGRAVVGRLSSVGRAVSTIQKVTDENYRGFARLVRKTDSGFVFGAEGVIEGQGEKLCRLRYVAETEPVEVGDEVYTGDHDGSQPYPMYYGRVVKAELKPGDQEWTILVKPAIQEIETETVTVLRTRLNATRTLTN